jgi:hypothetical protein
MQHCETFGESCDSSKIFLILIIIPCSRSTKTSPSDPPSSQMSDREDNLTLSDESQEYDFEIESNNTLLFFSAVTDGFTLLASNLSTAVSSPPEFAPSLISLK